MASPIRGVALSLAVLLEKGVGLSGDALKGADPDKVVRVARVVKAKTAVKVAKFTMASLLL
jgi:hypothetical protein